MKHAKFSPSSAGRWLVCTASPDMEAGKPDSPSSASATGTAYHAMAELAVGFLSGSSELPLTEFGGPIADAVAAAFAEVSTNPEDYMSERDCPFIDDCELETALDLLVPWCETLLELGGDFGGWELEVRVYIAPRVWGTVDAARRLDDGNLIIADLKTGRNPVSPENNLQLLTYAAGLWHESGCDATRIVLVIHQQGEAKIWETTPEVLENHQERVLNAVTTATLGGELVPGDHCRWCKAKTECGAFADAAADMATGRAVAEFGDPADAVAMLETWDGDTFARFFDGADFLIDALKTAQEVAAKRMHTEGLLIPGYKLIRKTKHKAWKDAKAAEKVLGPKALKSQLVTPTQAIKIFGEETVTPLYHTPVGDLAAAPVSSKGKPVPPLAAAEFNDKETTPKK